MATIYTTENFEQEVLKSDVPVLVDFWAEWCGPCKMFLPTIEKFAETANGFKVGKVNVDDNQALAERYGIMTIPTVLVFKNGEITASAVGVQTEEQLKALLAK